MIFGNSRYIQHAPGSGDNPIRHVGRCVAGDGGEGAGNGFIYRYDDEMSSLGKFFHISERSSRMSSSVTSRPKPDSIPFKGLRDFSVGRSGIIRRITE